MPTSNKNINNLILFVFPFIQLFLITPKSAVIYFSIFPLVFSGKSQGTLALWWYNTMTPSCQTVNGTTDMILNIEWCQNGENRGGFCFCTVSESTVCLDDSRAHGHTPRARTPTHAYTRENLEITDCFEGVTVQLNSCLIIISQMTRYRPWAALQRGVGARFFTSVKEWRGKREDRWIFLCC